MFTLWDFPVPPPQTLYSIQKCMLTELKILKCLTLT